MTNDETSYVVTTTIGRDWFDAQIAEIEQEVASQIGQAMHFTSLNRTRDARIHIELITSVLRSGHQLLVDQMFKS